MRVKPGTHWRQSRPYQQQSTFFADLLPVSATVDFQQSRPCWVQLCRQCAPGFTDRQTDRRTDRNAISVAERFYVTFA